MNYCKFLISMELFFCYYLREFNIASKFGWERYLVMFCCLVVSTVLDSVIFKGYEPFAFRLSLFCCFFFLKDE
jgi:hypothetical protein